MFELEHAARVCCVQVETVRRWMRTGRVPWRQAQRLDDAQRRLPAPWDAWMIDAAGRLTDGSVALTPGDARALHYWRQLRPPVPVRRNRY